MKAKDDGWEFYTDPVGRRHWRWPAATPRMGAGISVGDVGPRQPAGTLRREQHQAQNAPRTLDAE